MIPRIIRAVFLAVTVVMFALAALFAVNNGLALSREETLPGQVVDIVIRQAADGTLFYRPVVAFERPAGARRTLQLAEESTDPAYQVDDAVTLAYDPARPEAARIKTAASTASRWILPGILGILGLAFLAATLFARQVLGQDL